MSERAFLLPESRQRTADAIRDVESRTAAELVVTVRHEAARHHATSLAFGAGVAIVALVVMFLSPQAYDVRTMPLDALFAFALGFLSSTFVPSLRRRLTPRARLGRAAEKAAEIAFTEQGMHATRARTGILVYAALFERTALVVSDQGVPVALLGDAYARARSTLDESVSKLDFEAFLAALVSLGIPLAEALPRGKDDGNELCDQVV